MKKQFSLRSLTLSLIAISLLTIIVIITTTSSKADSPLATRLSGRVLLQVEDSGQAWYVSPDNNNQRIYLGSPQEAYCLMEILGLGISNNDLNRYLNDNNNKFPTRLSGKILLAVEQRGEAYYINPLNLKGYYLGKPLDAFNLIRELALGITNTNLNTIPVLDNTEMLNKCNIFSKEEITETNISLITNPVVPMNNFSHVVSITTTVDNPDNISIKERGLLYDFTIFPNTNLTPIIDNNNQKIVSISDTDSYTLNITNLTPGSYPFVRAYAVTNDNKVIYGNTITITGLRNIYLPHIPPPSSSLSSSSSSLSYLLKYTAGSNGSLSGATTQSVPKDSSGSPVIAVPDVGYYFGRWSDGRTDNPRTDSSVSNNIFVSAIFVVDCANLVVCGDSCVYSDKLYDTVVIGDQCWFQNNLNVGDRIDTCQAGPYADGTDCQNTCIVRGSSINEPADDGNIEKYCYNDLESNCDFYGGLYQWDEAMKYSTVQGSQGICPNNWHMPSDSDWTELTDWLVDEGGVTVGREGEALKDNTPASWNGTNSSGFTVIESGLRHESGVLYLGTNSYFWSSSSGLEPVPFSSYLNLSSSSAEVIRGNQDKNKSYSVRCLKNTSKTLTYTAGEHGSINATGTATTTQEVDYGEDGNTVTALPDVGYHFVEWSDGVTDNPRKDLFVFSDISVSAIFVVDCSGTIACGDACVYGDELYNTVDIGGQCWFKENLNIGTRINSCQDGPCIVGTNCANTCSTRGSSVNEPVNNGNIEKYCYNDLDSSCNLYGGLYKWDEAMKYSTVQGSQGICPNNWHIPSDSDLTTLTDYLGGLSVAGEKLKASSTDLMPWDGNNSSGFSAIISGVNYASGSFRLTNFSWLWSSSETTVGSLTARRRTLVSGSIAVARDTYAKTNGLSIRCLKD